MIFIIILKSRNKIYFLHITSPPHHITPTPHHPTPQYPTPHHPTPQYPTVWGPHHITPTPPLTFKSPLKVNLVKTPLTQGWKFGGVIRWFTWTRKENRQHQGTMRVHSEKGTIIPGLSDWGHRQKNR